MWSRICTTCPEKPHCGNCGVPFMNSTTSFDFTSLSINCSMLIFASFCGVAIGPVSARLTRTCHICTPNRCASKVKCQGAGMRDPTRSRVRALGVIARKHRHDSLGNGLGEAFIPDGSPYLGQTILGEPVCRSHVLPRTGDHRDETSIRCGPACRPLP